MEIGVAEALVGGLLTVLGGFLGKGYDWFKALSDKKKAESEVKVGEEKSHSEVRTTEVERAAVMYREMIADLRKDIDEMFSLLKEMEKERLTCREENAGMKAELKALRERRQELEEELRAATAG